MVKISPGAVAPDVLTTRPTSIAWTSGQAHAITRVVAVDHSSMPPSVPTKAPREGNS